MHVYMINRVSVQVCVFPVTVGLCGGLVSIVLLWQYTVYAKLFAGSVQMWEAVKAATKSCMIHGDIAIAS